MSEEHQLLLEQTTDALKKIQEYEVEDLEQRDRLGKDLSFLPAIETAKKLVEFYKKLTVDALPDIPDAKLKQVLDQASADLATFDAMRTYDVGRGKAERDNLINNLKNRYPQIFDVLHPFISYSMHRATDFEGLEVRARAVLQQISSQAENVQQSMRAMEAETKAILQKVKDVAVEQGVTQQAVYFKEQAKQHETKADHWLNLTRWAAGIILVYSGAALASAYFLPKPADLYATVQLVAGKILVFAVLSFALYFAAKNYFSFKHNALIDKHRQNALVTYEAIVRAAQDTANTDIILNHVASCIFVPQNTGFSLQKGLNAPGGNLPMNFLLKQATGE